MKFLDKPRRAGLVVAVLGLGSFLHAQPAPTDELPGQAPKPANQLSKLSLADMLTRGTEYANQVKVDLRHVKHLQYQARRLKDIIKLNCVTDKFVEIKAQANIFDQEHRDLEAMAGTDAGDRYGVFDLVSTAAANVHKIRQEADGCVGEPELQESLNAFEHPPFPDDPTVGNPFGTGVEPPGYASPFN